jgi:hypothetical protein
VKANPLRESYIGNSVTNNPIQNFGGFYA